MHSLIANIDLHTYGRHEINLAEYEMPGLMALREKYKDTKPLANAHISGSLHMTVQTAVLIETLHILGAKIKWCSCNIHSTQDHAAAAIVKANTATIFAWQNETIEDYWNCIDNALDWGDIDGPDLIVDDGSDMTLLIHKGLDYEKLYEQNIDIPYVGNSPDERALHTLLLNKLTKDPKRWHKLCKKLCGVSEETTTGIKRLTQLYENNNLICPVINVNDSVTKSKFDNIYGCRHSLPDGIMRATDMMIAGKKVLVCGYGDVGKGCAEALKAAGARVFVTEIDPICALQAIMNGYEVVRLEQVISVCDIFITATGNCNIIMAADMVKMKNNALVGNIGHFDNEIDIANLQKIAKKTNIKYNVDKWTFANNKFIIVLAEGRLLNLGCGTGHPSFVMSCSFSNQVLAQIELWTNKGLLQNKLYLIKKTLDEEVAKIHVEALGGNLTILTPEQCAYVNLSPTGPFKTDNYKY